MNHIQFGIITTELGMGLNLLGNKMVPLNKNKQNKFLHENGIIIIVFVYNFSDNNTLEALQKQSNYVSSYLRFSSKQSKNEYIYTRLFFLVYQSPTHSQNLDI